MHYVAAADATARSAACGGDRFSTHNTMGYVYETADSDGGFDPGAGRRGGAGDEPGGRSDHRRRPAGGARRSGAGTAFRLCLVAGLLALERLSPRVGRRLLGARTRGLA